MTADPTGPGHEEALEEAGHSVAADTHSADRGRRSDRRRARIPVGDAFISRLGPAGDELFAGIDDPDDAEEVANPERSAPVDGLRFVALDCETTGQSPHRLVELGAVAFTLDRHLMSFETLVHSTDRINPFARRIHGISTETLGGAPPTDRVLERFARFIRGAVLIEHSADAFDTRLIARTLRQPLSNDNIDTSRLAAKLWDLRDTIGLEKLCQELDVRHRRPHHALADAEATAECFIALVSLGRDKFGWGTLGDLLDAGQPPPPRVNGNGRAPDGTVRRRRRGARRRRRPAGAPESGADDGTPAASAD